MIPCFSVCTKKSMVYGLICFISSITYKRLQNKYYATVFCWQAYLLSSRLINPGHEINIFCIWWEWKKYHHKIKILLTCERSSIIIIIFVRQIFHKNIKINAAFSLLLASMVSLLGTFDWWLACGSWVNSWWWHSAALVEHLGCSGLLTAWTRLHDSSSGQQKLHIRTVSAPSSD